MSLRSYSKDNFNKAMTITVLVKVIIYSYRVLRIADYIVTLLSNRGVYAVEYRCYIYGTLTVSLLMCLLHHVFS